jgi:hypothetical protein
MARKDLLRHVERYLKLLRAPPLKNNTSNEKSNRSQVPVSEERKVLYSGGESSIR